MNRENIKKVTEWAKERLEVFRHTRAGNDKYLHCHNVVTILKKMGVEEDLAEMLGWIHDTGRVEQLKLFEGFKDNLVLHHYLGEDAITRALYQGKIEPSAEIDFARYIVMYHGRRRFVPFPENLDGDVKSLIEKTSIADDIENGCCGAVTYLVAEKTEDVKGYSASNPEVDQTTVSAEVWEFYKNGEKFDKMKYCKTYADYFLFAAVLAIQVLKGDYHDIAKDVMMMPAGEYETALAGYEDILGNHVEAKYAEEAIEILKSYL